MPVNETWWNPYRLLDKKKSVNIQGNSIEKFRKASYSGNIEAKLTNLNLFFVGENKGGDAKKKLFLINNDNFPFIPGTSIKGMIRSLAEYINGDPPIVGDNSYRPDSSENIPMTFNMFGYMGKGSILKGKISFSDAISKEKIKAGIQKNYLPGSPKKTHSAFYSHDNLQKFYFHQGEHYNPELKSGNVPETNSKGNKPINIEALPPGNIFKFNIYFENLSEKELKLLLYCLSLEKGLSKTIGKGESAFEVNGDMAHKIGRAKSYGLGSVRIDLEKLELFPDNPAERYTSYKSNKSSIYLGEELIRYIQQKLEPFYNDHSDHMENLRKMMIFDPESQTTFKYPSHPWFKHELNEDESPKSRNKLKPI